MKITEKYIILLLVLIGFILPCFMIGTPFSSLSSGDDFSLVKWTQENSFSDLLDPINYRGQIVNRYMSYFIIKGWSYFFGISSTAWYILYGIFMAMSVIFIYKIAVLLSNNKNIGVLSSFSFLFLIPFKFGQYGIMWLSTIFTIISFAFMLITLYLGFKYLIKGGKRLLALTILFFFLALTSKETNIIIPFFFLFFIIFNKQLWHKRSSYFTVFSFFLSFLIVYYIPSITQEVAIPMGEDIAFTYQRLQYNILGYGEIYLHQIPSLLIFSVIVLFIKRKTIYFLIVVFFCIGFTPYMFKAWFDERYMMQASLGMSLLFGIVLSDSIQLVKKMKVRRISRLLTLSLIVILIYNSFTIAQHGNESIKLFKARAIVSEDMRRYVCENYSENIFIESDYSEIAPINGKRDDFILWGRQDIKRVYIPKLYMLPKGELSKYNKKWFCIVMFKKVPKVEGLDTEDKLLSNYYFLEKHFNELEQCKDFILIEEFEYGIVKGKIYRIDVND